MSAPFGKHFADSSRCIGLPELETPLAANLPKLSAQWSSMMLNVNTTLRLGQQMRPRKHFPFLGPNLFGGPITDKEKHLDQLPLAAEPAPSQE